MQAPDRPRHPAGRGRGDPRPARLRGRRRRGRRTRTGGPTSTARPTSSSRSCASPGSTACRRRRCRGSSPACRAGADAAAEAHPRSPSARSPRSGLREAVTWSFISKPHAELFGGGAPALALANPIAADLSDMRPSLVPGLAAAAERNARRGSGDVALFEVGQVFLGDGENDQRIAAAALRRGLAKRQGEGRHWTGGGGVDVFDAKGDALALLAALGVPPARCRSSPAARRSCIPAAARRCNSGRRTSSAGSASCTPAPARRSTSRGRWSPSRSLLDAIPAAEGAPDQGQAEARPLRVHAGRARSRLRRRRRRPAPATSSRRRSPPTARWSRTPTCSTSIAARACPRAQVGRGRGDAAAARAHADRRRDRGDGRPRSSPRWARRPARRCAHERARACSSRSAGLSAAPARRSDRLRQVRGPARL